MPQRVSLRHPVFFRREEIVYETKRIKKEIYHIIIPMILENILQISASLITTAMVGRLLANDISAQGICVRLTDTLWVFYKGVAIGATVLIARAFGAGRHGQCRKITEQTMLTEIVLVIVIQAVLLFRSDVFLAFFSKDPKILSLAAGYMRIILIGFPFVVIMTLVTAAFQGYGNTKIPMYIAGVMNAVNIVCGYVFIFGVGGMQGGGIKGAAAALVTAQAAGAALGLFLLYKKGGLFADSRREGKFFSLDKKCIREVYTTGIPAALESMFWQFSAIILSKIILFYGSAAFAAYQLGIQAETITEMPAIGFSTASTTLTARAMGKGDRELRKIYFKELIKVAFAISLVTSLLLILLPNAFMKMMTNKTELQAIGVVYVFVMGFIQIPQNLSRIYNGTIRAMGYKNTPMLVAGFGIWIVRIPCCLLAAYVFRLPLLSIWLVIALDQVSRFLLSVFLMKRIEKKEKCNELQREGKLSENNSESKRTGSGN